MFFVFVLLELNGFQISFPFYLFQRFHLSDTQTQPSFFSLIFTYCSSIFYFSFFRLFLFSPLHYSHNSCVHQFHFTPLLSFRWEKKNTQMRETETRRAADQARLTSPKYLSLSLDLPFVARLSLVACHLLSLIVASFALWRGLEIFSQLPYHPISFVKHNLGNKKTRVRRNTEKKMNGKQWEKEKKQKASAERIFAQSHQRVLNHWTNSSGSTLANNNKNNISNKKKTENNKESENNNKIHGKQNYESHCSHSPFL